MKRKLMVLVVLFLIFGTLAILNKGQVLANQSEGKIEVEDYINALENDFADDKIIIVLNKKVSFQFKEMLL